MPNLPHYTVTPKAHLTLHYRLASERGEDILSTFGGRPATLQLGSGQLSPSLEACLLGLEEGAHRTFILEPEEAFGSRNPDLLQRIPLTILGQKRQQEVPYLNGDPVAFTAPGGGRFAGVLRMFDGEDALFDFNHPLAGQTVQFEVKIIGILA